MNLEDANYAVAYEARRLRAKGLIPDAPEWRKFVELVDELERTETEYMKAKGSIPR